MHLMFIPNMRKNLLFLIIGLCSISCNERETDFELCGFGIVKPYYFTGLEYKGEIYQIEKEIKEHWVSPETNNNGIAKVRFKVNCHGHIGDLHYEEYDTNYVQTQLHETIESQLIEKVSQLSDWIPGVNELLIIQNS